MRKGTKEQQGGLGKKKMVLTAEVSYQEDIWLNCCMDGTMEDLRRSIWRNWREAGGNGKAVNSSRGRILKGRVMS